ncbi:MAG: TIM barrel protein [Candidatus Njordarchaeia archaeon]
MSSGNNDFGKRFKKIRFGPAGKPLNFKGRVEEVPAFLHQIGLNALEVQQVRGINIKEGQAKIIGEEAKKHDVKLSMHGPYAVNLSSTKPEVLSGTKERLLKALKIAEIMGAEVVVFHPGYYGNLDKEEALKKALNLLREIEEEARSLGIKKAHLGAETTGKKSQLGSLDEIIEMTQDTDIVVPVIDFAHLHARDNGAIAKREDYEAIFDKLEEKLGSEAKRLHIHFSKIEFTDKGEKRHHPFGSGYGPDFVPLIEVILERDIEATIICETPKLDKDALRMKEITEKIAFRKFKSRKELEKLE